MITVCLFIVVCAAAALCITLALADRMEPWLMKQIRRIKRTLAARWLAEEGLTVTPLEQKEGLKRRVSHDEMMEIIGRI